MMGPTYRVVLYSHDSQGLGHVRRNLAIAHHLARLLPEMTGVPVSGLLISGLAPAARFPLPEGFDWVTIPGVAKSRDGYVPRSLSGSTRELIRLRSQLLEAVLVGFDPDLVIIDRHIYGVWRELHRPLLKLREQQPAAKVVLGLREVLDSPEVAAAEWAALGDPARLRDLVDQVWIYGDQDVYDPVATGETPEFLADRVQFTGYLARGRRISDHGAAMSPAPFVLTTAGGGSDGVELLRAAAAMPHPQGHAHIVVTGPQISDADYDEVLAAAVPGTQVYRSWPGLSGQIAHAAAVMSMGGYNTVTEILATDTPALIVPREKPRLEQLIRATALSRHGAVDVLRTTELSSAALGAWAAAAVTRRVDRSELRLDGLAATARLAAELMNPLSLVVGAA